MNLSSHSKLGKKKYCIKESGYAIYSIKIKSKMDECDLQNFIILLAIIILFLISGLCIL